MATETESYKVYHAWIHDILATKNPKKVGMVPQLLAKYPGREYGVYVKVCGKYGMTPKPEWQPPTQSASQQSKPKSKSKPNESKLPSDSTPRTTTTVTVTGSDNEVVASKKLSKSSSKARGLSVKSKSKQQLSRPTSGKRSKPATKTTETVSNDKSNNNNNNSGSSSRVTTPNTTSKGRKEQSLSKLKSKSKMGSSSLSTIKRNSKSKSPRPPLSNNSTNELKTNITAATGASNSSNNDDNTNGSKTSANSAMSNRLANLKKKRLTKPSSHAETGNESTTPNKTPRSNSGSNIATTAAKPPQVSALATVTTMKETKQDPLPPQPQPQPPLLPNEIEKREKHKMKHRKHDNSDGDEYDDDYEDDFDNYSDDFDDHSDMTSNNKENTYIMNTVNVNNEELNKYSKYCEEHSIETSKHNNIMTLFVQTKHQKYLSEIGSKIYSRGTQFKEKKHEIIQTQERTNIEYQSKHTQYTFMNRQNNTDDIDSNNNDSNNHIVSLKTLSSYEKERLKLFIRRCTPVVESVIQSNIQKYGLLKSGGNNNDSNGDSLIDQLFGKQLSPSHNKSTKSRRDSLNSTGYTGSVDISQECVKIADYRDMPQCLQNLLFMKNRNIIGVTFSNQKNSHINENSINDNSSSDNNNGINVNTRDSSINRELKIAVAYSMPITTDDDKKQDKTKESKENVKTKKIENIDCANKSVILIWDINQCIEEQMKNGKQKENSIIIPLKILIYYGEILNQNCMTFDNTNDFLIIGKNDGSISLWDLREPDSYHLKETLLFDDNETNIKSKIAKPTKMNVFLRLPSCETACDWNNNHETQIKSIQCYKLTETTDGNNNSNNNNSNGMNDSQIACEIVSIDINGIVHIWAVNQMSNDPVSLILEKLNLANDIMSHAFDNDSKEVETNTMEKNNEIDKRISVGIKDNSRIQIMLQSKIDFLKLIFGNIHNRKNLKQKKTLDEKKKARKQNNINSFENENENENVNVFINEYDPYYWLFVLQKCVYLLKRIGNGNKFKLINKYEQTSRLDKLNIKNMNNEYSSHPMYCLFLKWNDFEKNILIGYNNGTVCNFDMNGSFPIHHWHDNDGNLSVSSLYCFKFDDHEFFAVISNNEKLQIYSSEIVSQECISKKEFDGNAQLMNLSSNEEEQMNPILAVLVWCHEKNTIVLHKLL